MLPLTIANPEMIAYMQAITADESTYQDDVMQARRYDAGEQFVALTDRLRTFLGGDASDTSADWRRLRLNVCRIVLTAVVEKLIVSGFDSDETAAPTAAPDGSTQTVKPTAAYAWRIWQQNRMDAKQRRVHEQALRDSEAFVIVDWDNTKMRPRFTPHQRYIDGAAGGDGDGCRAFYRNDDPDQDLLFVTKRWQEVYYPGGVRVTRQRLTIYYPDRIEKFAGLPGAEIKVVDADDEPWPIPWFHADGTPLGIPVAHFRSSAGMEARDAWPLQNAINKVFVDLMQESDISAFRILLAFGWKPVDADGNPLRIEPGTWMGSEKADARAQEVTGSDLSQFLNVMDNLLYKVAIVTDTPVSRFTTTKQVAAEGTQKQQDSPLLNKARNRAAELGDAWEQALLMAVRLENTFGAGGLNEAVTLSAVWEPFNARDEAADIAKAEAYSRLGLPLDIIGTVLGLTVDQIAAWQKDKDARRADMAAALQGQAQQQQDTQQQGA